ncbi:MAG TPA: hypothetical protein VIH66_05075, partial [Gammaproteobacteria bacterium]
MDDFFAPLFFTAFFFTGLFLVAAFFLAGVFFAAFFLLTGDFADDFCLAAVFLAGPPFFFTAFADTAGRSWTASALSRGFLAFSGRFARILITALWMSVISPM